MTDPIQPDGQEEKQELSPEEQIAARVHAAQASEFNQFDEDTGDVIPNAEPNPDAPVVEPEADKPAVEVEADKPEPPAKHKVKILGTEEEVDVDELIRNYQKNRAADVRLQNAARKERQIDEYLSQIQKGQLPPGAAPNQPAPSQDAPQEINGLNIPAIKAEIRSELHAELESREQVNTFKREFPDIAADPDLWNAAVRLEQLRIDTAEALGEPLGDAVEAYRKHGEAIRKKFKLNPEPSPDKVALKRTLTVVPATSARAPTATPPKPQTVSELIEEERKSRVKGAIK